MDELGEKYKYDAKKNEKQSRFIISYVRTLFFIIIFVLFVLNHLKCTPYINESSDLNSLICNFVRKQIWILVIFIAAITYAFYKESTNGKSKEEKASMQSFIFAFLSSFFSLSAFIFVVKYLPDFRDASEMKKIIAAQIGPAYDELNQIDKKAGAYTHLLNHTLDTISKRNLPKKMLDDLAERKMTVNTPLFQTTISMDKLSI